MDFEIWIFIRNLAIVLFVIGIPLSIVNLMFKRRALAIVNDMPAEIKNTLFHSAVRIEEAGIQRLKYIRKNIIFGISILVLMVSVSVFMSFIEEGTVDIEDVMVPVVVFLPFIVAFIIRDILRVAPWSEAYQIKAVVGVTVRRGRECYTCYYDFADGDFSVGRISVPGWNSGFGRCGGVVDVLAVIKGNKVKLIDFI